MDAERAKTIAYNAIIMLECIDGNEFHEDLISELGITEEEYKEIMESDDL